MNGFSSTSAFMKIDYNALQGLLVLCWPEGLTKLNSCTKCLNLHSNMIFHLSVGMLISGYIWASNESIATVRWKT